MAKKNKASGPGERVVPHNRLTFDEAEIQAATEALTTGQWASGPAVVELEQALAAYTGRTAAVAVGSGVAALRLALKALDVKAGDEVIVPAYSCVALASAVHAVGAHAVAVDVTAGDWNLDADAVEAALTPATKAVMAVNTFGSPVPDHFFERVPVPVIEDCAHGFGKVAGGGVMGGRGVASILSFYATKLMGAGEGGAVLTNDTAIAAHVAQARSYVDQDPEKGLLNDKMTDVEARLASCQLERLGAMVEARANLAARYHALLHEHASTTQAFHVPRQDDQRVWYRYVIELAEAAVPELMMAMEARGVMTAQPVTPWQSAHTASCPVAAKAYRSLVSIPLYPTLRREEQDLVVESLKASINEIAA